MSTVAEINQRIAVANAESSRLNNERNINLGKKQTLEAQLATLLEKYSKDYGVKLTLETLQAEADKVLKEKEAELTKVEGLLTAIQNGEYEKANEAVAPKEEEVVVTNEQGNVESTFTVPVENVVTKEQVEALKAQTVAPTVDEIKAMANANVAPAQTQVVAPPTPAPVQTAPVAPPPTQAVTPPTPVAPPPVTEPVKPTQTVQPVENLTKPTLNLSGIDALADFIAPPPTSKSATPKVEAPKEEKVDKKDEVVTPDLTSFSAILGGTQFKP